MGGGKPTEADLAAAADNLARLVRRVRSLSPRALQQRREPLRVALARLAELDAELEGRQVERAEVPDHVLADAIAVIGGDALAMIGWLDSAGLSSFVAAIEEALAGTR